MENDLNVLTEHIKDFAASKPTLDSYSNFSIRDECFLEGVLSRSWQTWNAFWRISVIESCMGTVDATGGNIARSRPACCGKRKRRILSESQNNWLMG